MANMTLRNIPDDIYNALKVKAEKNRRSLNQEAIQIIAENLEGTTFPDRETETTEELIQRLRRFRATLPEGFFVDDDDFNRLKRAGRK